MSGTDDRFEVALDEQLEAIFKSEKHLRELAAVMHRPALEQVLMVARPSGVSLGAHALRVNRLLNALEGVDKSREALVELFVFSRSDHRKTVFKFGERGQELMQALAELDAAMKSMGLQKAPPGSSARKPVGHELASEHSYPPPRAATAEAISVPALQSQESPAVIPAISKGTLSTPCERCGDDTRYSRGPLQASGRRLTIRAYCTCAPARDTEFIAIVESCLAAQEARKKEKLDLFRDDAVDGEEDGPPPTDS